MYTATETQTGNFAVTTSPDSVLPIAMIVKTPLGWKVMSRTSARSNSRTASATPQEAARKYFSKKVEFIMTVSL